MPVLSCVLTLAKSKAQPKVDDLDQHKYVYISNPHQDKDLYSSGKKVTTLGVIWNQEKRTCVWIFL